MADQDLFSSIRWRTWHPEATLFTDGAMSTQLCAMGLADDMPPEWWNRQQPDQVLKAHMDFVKAGSEVLCTNTFGANRSRLARYGLESFVSVLNHQAVSIARTAIGNHKRVLVWGSMGPLDECIDPKDAIDIYREQIDALTAAGVDGFLIETMTRVDEALAALEASLNANLPVVVSLTVDSVGAMYGDETPGVSALRALVDSGASAVGFNCSSEFAILEKLLKRAREVVNVPLYVAPSAGIPTFEGNKWHYPLSPLKWANQTLKLRNAGAQIVGGCCGVTPKHIHTLWMHALVETGRSKGESKE